MSRLWSIIAPFLGQWAAGPLCGTMPQAGFEPTKVGVTGFQLNVKRTIYHQATTAGLVG